MLNSEILNCRKLLRAKEAELEAALQKRDEIAIEKEPDELDEVQLSRSRDLAIRELDRKANLLRQVRVALEKIEDSTYGLCEECGERIGSKRLAAVPWATLCLRCQEAADNASGSDDASAVARRLNDAAA